LAITKLSTAAKTLSITTKDKIAAFFAKYKIWVHLFLIGWNIFVTSWMTGESIPLTELGIAYSIDARHIVSFMQANFHVPTWLVAVATGLMNISIAYITWKKNGSSNSKT
jgi:hypothetical protein